MNTTKHDRAIGAVLGSAAGDALGAATSSSRPSRNPRPSAWRAAAPSAGRRGEWTDDTSMAVPILRTLARGGVPPTSPCSTARRGLGSVGTDRPRRRHPDTQTCSPAWRHAPPPTVALRPARNTSSRASPRGTARSCARLRWRSAHLRDEVGEEAKLEHRRGCAGDQRSDALRSRRRRWVRPLVRRDPARGADRRARRSPRARAARLDRRQLWRSDSSAPSTPNRSTSPTRTAGSCPRSRPPMRGPQELHLEDALVRAGPHRQRQRHGRRDRREAWRERCTARRHSRPSGANCSTGGRRCGRTTWSPSASRPSPRGSEGRGQVGGCCGGILRPGPLGGPEAIRTQRRRSSTDRSTRATVPCSRSSSTQSMPTVGNRTACTNASARSPAAIRPLRTSAADSTAARGSGAALKSIAVSSGW